MSDHLTDPHELAETIDTMRRLHAEEQARPSPAFVQSLERRLFQSAASAGLTENLQSSTVVSATRSHNRLRIAERFQWLGLVALIALVTTSTIWFTGRDGGDVRLETPLVREANVVWSLPAVENPLLEGFSMNATTDVIVRMTPSSGPVELEAIDVETGASLWRREVGSSLGGSTLGTPASATIAVDGQDVYILSPSTTLLALDLMTGEERWSKAISGSGVSIQARDGRVFVWHTDYTLTVFDASSGSELWTTGKLAPLSELLMGPFVGETVVVVAAAPGELRAYDLDSGLVIWSYHDDFDTLNVSMASSSDERGETLYLYGTNAMSNPTTASKWHLVAINASDGSMIWRTTLENGGRFGIVADDDHVYVVDVRMDDQIATPTTYEEVLGRIFAYARETGEITWNSSLQVMRADLVLSQRGLLTSFGFDALMAVIDTTSNTELCRLSIPRLHLNERVMAGDLMIMMQEEGTLIAIDPVASCSG